MPFWQGLVIFWHCCNTVSCVLGVDCRCALHHHSQCLLYLIYPYMVFSNDNMLPHGSSSGTLSRQIHIVPHHCWIRLHLQQILWSSWSRSKLILCGCLSPAGIMAFGDLVFESGYRIGVWCCSHRFLGHLVLKNISWTSIWSSKAWYVSFKSISLA